MSDELPKSTTESQEDQALKTTLAIFMASVTVRLLALWLVPEPHLPYNAVFAYLRGAQLLLEGQGFSDGSFPVYTPPFYSMCIAMVTLLSGGDGIVGTKLLQIAIDSSTAALLYAIFRDLFDRPTAYLSAIIWTLYPFAVYPTLYIGTETLFTFFITLWVFLNVRAMGTDKWQYHCGAGIILGLATLTRGATQFVPLLLPFILFAFRKWNPHWIRGYLLSLVCFILVILPWGARNYLVLHEIIPIAANNSVVLFGSSEPLWTIDTRVLEMPHLLEKAKVKGILPPSSESARAERDSFDMKLAIENYLERIKTDPVSMIPFMAKKFARLWYSTESGNNHGITLGVNMLIYVPAIVGVVVAWRRKKSITVLLLCLIGYFVLLHWLTLPLFRYMVPVMPYVIGFAAFGLVVVFEQKWPEMHRRLRGGTRKQIV